MTKLSRFLVTAPSLLLRDYFYRCENKQMVVCREFKEASGIPRSSS